jgi:CO dehydrogenase/acetyl-CoA synthase delta subunit
LGWATVHRPAQAAARITRIKGTPLKNESSFNLSWRPRALREPRTTMRVWVVLCGLTVAIMGVAIIADMNAETIAVRTAK